MWLYFHYPTRRHGVALKCSSACTFTFNCAFTNMDSLCAPRSVCVREAALMADLEQNAALPWAEHVYKILRNYNKNTLIMQERYMESGR